MTSNSSTIRIDAGRLSSGNGLLLLLTRALDKLKSGDLLDILSDDPSAEHDLPSWARLHAHRFVSRTFEGGRFSYRIEKGSALRVLTREQLDWGNRAPLHE